jgi:hypothetical protein
MQVKLMTLNEPNLNGLTYSTDVVKKAIDEYIARGKPMLIQRAFSREAGVNLENVCGEVKDIQFNDFEMSGTVHLFPNDEALRALHVRPAFVGRIEEGMVKDIELLSFNFTADPA